MPNHSMFKDARGVSAAVTTVLSLIGFALLVAIGHQSDGEHLLEVGVSGLMFLLGFGSDPKTVKQVATVIEQVAEPAIKQEGTKLIEKYPDAHDLLLATLHAEAATMEKPVEPAEADTVSDPVESIAVPEVEPVTVPTAEADPVEAARARYA